MPKTVDCLALLFPEACTSVSKGLTWCDQSPSLICLHASGSFVSESRRPRPSTQAHRPHIEAKEAKNLPKVGCSSALQIDERHGGVGGPRLHSHIVRRTMQGQA